MVVYVDRAKFVALRAAAGQLVRRARKPGRWGRVPTDDIALPLHSIASGRKSVLRVQDKPPMIDPNGTDDKQ